MVIPDSSLGHGCCPFSFGQYVQPIREWSFHAQTCLHSKTWSKFATTDNCIKNWQTEI